MIIFYNFRHWLTQQQCIDELNSIFSNEAPSRTSVYRWYVEFNQGLSSVQNQLLFRKLLILCANWYCKIAMWPLIRLRQSYALVGPACIQYCMNIWLSKKFVRFESRIICQSLKKINQSQWQKCFDNWVKRMQKCLDLNEEHFEKQ